MSEVIRLSRCTSIPSRRGAVPATVLTAAVDASQSSLHCFVLDLLVLTPAGLRTTVKYGFLEAAAKYV